MGFVFTKQDERVVLALLRVLTVFFAVCICTKVWTSVATVGAARAVAAAALRAGMSTPGTTQEVSPDGGAVEQLPERELPVPATPRQAPMLEVTGLLGDEALVNGHWCRVGDRMGEARILAVEATQVRVLWEGQTLTYSPAESGRPPSSDRLQYKTPHVFYVGRDSGPEMDLPTYSVRASDTGAAHAGKTRTLPPSAPPRQSPGGFWPEREMPGRGLSPEATARLPQRYPTGPPKRAPRRSFQINN